MNELLPQHARRPGCSCGTGRRAAGTGRAGTKREQELAVSKKWMGCAVTPLSPHRPNPRSSVSGHHICSPLRCSSHPLRCPVLCHTIQPCIQCCSTASPSLPPPCSSLQSTGGAGRAKGNSSLVPGRFCALTFPPAKHSHFQEADLC